MGKVLLIISLVITLLSAGLGIVNKSKLSQAKGDLDQANSSLAKKDDDLKKATASLKTATDNLKAATDDKNQATAQLASAQSDLEAAKKQVTDLTTEKTNLSGQVTQLTADKEDLQKKYDDLSKTQPGPATGGDTAQLQAQVQELQTMNAQLQKTADAAQAEAADLKKKDQDRLAHSLRKGVEGRVLAVNPAWNFVILSLGDKSGLSSNTELLVKRGTQLVGKVRVTSVDPSTSVADIVSNNATQGATISPGDHVIYQGSED